MHRKSSIINKDTVLKSPVVIYIIVASLKKKKKMSHIIKTSNSFTLMWSRICFRETAPSLKGTNKGTALETLTIKDLFCCN